MRDPSALPESTERKRRVRAAARRREAVTLLNVAGGTIHYCVRQLGNGIGPEEARLVAAEAAEELAVVARELRRLTRLGPAERRVLARQLVALGMTRHEAAVRLGLSDSAVRSYLRQGSSRSG